jgi:hypothetical protein
MPRSVPTRPFVRRKASHSHPRVLAHLQDNDFYPLTISIQSRTGERTPTGGWSSPGVWQDVLVGIPARRGLINSGERRSTWGRVDQYIYDVALNGYYPEVKADMRAVTSDGIEIDIRGVMHDSDTRMTTFSGRTVNPGSEGFL